MGSVISGIFCQQLETSLKSIQFNLIDQCRKLHRRKNHKKWNIATTVRTFSYLWCITRLYFTDGHGGPNCLDENMLHNEIKYCQQTRIGGNQLWQANIYILCCNYNVHLHERRILLSLLARSHIVFPSVLLIHPPNWSELSAVRQSEMQQGLQCRTIWELM